MEAPAAALRRAVRSRAVTFVVGAGISFPYGIPTWGELARRVWMRSFPDRASVWTGDDGDGLVPKQFFPIVFELASRRLGDRDGSHTSLSACLYGDLDPAALDEAASGKPPTSLGAIARVLAAEVAARRAARRPRGHVQRRSSARAGRPRRLVRRRQARRAELARDAAGPTAPARRQLITRPSQHPDGTTRAARSRSTTCTGRSRRIRAKPSGCGASSTRSCSPTASTGRRRPPCFRCRTRSWARPSTTARASSWGSR